MRRTLWWFAAATVAVLVLASIAVVSWPTLRNLAGGDASSDSWRPDTSGTGPGSLVEATRLEDVATASGAKRMQGARITYRSTSGADRRVTVVTGTVYVPLGSPPAGGWPVVGFGHPTTGIDENCAPSQSGRLRGMIGVVGGLVDRGYAVTMADYEGLGSPGVHRYTDHRTAGHNIIDSVRALRHTFAGVSDRWAAMGASQGGAAVWSADEQAEDYAPELNLVGAVAYVPAADMTGLVDKSVAGTLTKAQHYSLAAIVESLARLHPDLNRDDYRRGAALENWDVLVACRGDVEDRRKRTEDALKPGDLAPATPAAAERLRAYLRDWALPQGPLTAPLFVTYVGQDQSIDVHWTADAIRRACVVGGEVQTEMQPDNDHNNVVFDAGLTWMADRFAGTPAGNDCPR
ncbi:lipase family protein [Mycobacterium deserti]|uniref:Lipase family protein n=1 Tax=Mycobacterium deserti TaxID=2978347 RepID=A0ABT2MF43_9MYCO|nr:lipase family protein [Mycobacterium deserti]MCT7660904.1 lipase family protein [Mycobacterium deserti]